MLGYNENFLDGIRLPLPAYSIDLDSEILKRDNLRNSVIADYIHYSVVMNRSNEKRSPAFVALNINQNQHLQTDRTNRWKTDPRIGFDNQLDNEYYRNNPWDKGHMARRTTAAWGESQLQAQRASNETFYYTNACLQHANINQDEWLALEDWVFDLKLDADGRITTFSGPFYADFDRSIKPDGRPLALIPAGFFKIVCFKNKESGKLDVRAFVMYQDEKALEDKSGHKRYNNQTYQTTVSLIEELTGLQFDDEVYQANPMRHNVPIEQPASGANGHATPSTAAEHIEIGRSSDILSASDPRQTINDDIVDIFISAAMINPKGKDKGHEWISLLNLGSSNVNLHNWKLIDNSDRSKTIEDITLKPGESFVVNEISPLQLGNQGDVIKLFDAQGARIDWVNYSKHMVKEGQPIVFLSPRDTLE